MIKKTVFALALLPLLLSCSQSSSKKPSFTLLANTASNVDYQKSARLNVELGLGYLKQGQLARAKSKLNRAKNLAPELPEVHYAHAFFHEEVGEIEKAEKDHLKSIALNAKGGNEHNHYGAFLCRQARYKEADSEFLRAMEDPNYTNTAETLENAGLCALQVPDKIKAQQYFEKALRYDNNRENALLELAILEFKKNNIQQSQAYLNYYEKIAKPSARALMLGMRLARHMRNTQKEASYRVSLHSHFPKAAMTIML